MTCYQRHLGWLFDAVGVPYELEGRARVHHAFIEMLGLSQDARCPEIWEATKLTYGIDTKTESAELAADLSRALVEG